MISLLSQIVAQFVCWIETALAFVFNALVSALAAVVGGLLGLLPSMPSMPSMPSQVSDALGFAAWFFPIGTVVNIFGFLVGAWLIWLIVSMGLRWIRAVE